MKKKAVDLVNKNMNIGSDLTTLELTMFILTILAIKYLRTSNCKKWKMRSVKKDLKK